uniref:Uncharacterized protein n=1 Tax=Knipowitschia caucasica TaxID=637954 RepID=A0AAV2LDX5_KNICA
MAAESPDPSLEEALSPEEERELLLLRTEIEELHIERWKQKERGAALIKEKEVLTGKIQEAIDLNLSHDLFQQAAVVKEMEEATEKQWEIVEEKKALRSRMETEIAELNQRKKEKLRTVENQSGYYKLLDKVVKKTKFAGVEELINHLQNLFHMRDKARQAENDKLEEIDQNRRQLLSLEEQHHMSMIRKNYDLAQNQTELEKCQSEERIWQQRWDKIQETATKKTMMVGQLKMATLNLYEMTGGVVGEGGVDINDTQAQLDMIVDFIRDTENIIKQYQLSQQQKSTKRDTKVSTGTN